MTDPFKTRIETVPVPVSEPKEAPPAASEAGALSSTKEPVAKRDSSRESTREERRDPHPSDPSRPSRIPLVPPSHSHRLSALGYGAPSSDSTWVAEPGVDRTTEPHITIPEQSKKDRATLTVITGFNAGEVFALDGTEHSLGRGTDTDVWIEDTAVSRVHAKIYCTTDGTYVVHDQKSTNGTFVNGQRVERQELSPSDRIQLGPNVALRFAIVDDAEEELQRRLYESSTRDSLTRCYNRKYFGERLTAEVAHSRRHRVKLSLLLLDLDEFKKLNDTFGHVAGDMVLRMVAAQMMRLIRVEDLLARYGGEEFVILARSTGRTEAVKLAERIRDSLAQMTVAMDAKTDVRITASVGVATMSETGTEATSNDLVVLADRRLYRAKALGRNRVCCDDEP